MADVDIINVKLRKLICDSTIQNERSGEINAFKQTIKEGGEKAVEFLENILESLNDK